MKTRNHMLKSIGVFALALIMLASVILPMSAMGSSIDGDVVATYTVKTGDTLSSIASAYGVTVSSIVNANGISASADLYKGQKLQIPGALSVNEDTTTNYTTSSTISVNFKEADLIGALETVLAHTGYTMIFKGETAEVSLTLDNVTPMTAIDYILRMVDMSYIKNDNIIYVGPIATLNSNFIDNKALAKFSTKYISTENLMSQLSTLGVNVTYVKNDSNIRDFWVSGYPMELAKMRQVIKTLDIKKNQTIGSGAISSSLSAIELKYLTADEFNTILSSLGIPGGITVAIHPQTLYVYVTGDAYNDIINIKKLVDYKDASAVDADKGEGTGEGTGTGSDVVLSDGENSLVKLDLQYLTKTDVTSIISTFGYEVEVLGLDLYEKRVWLRGTTDEVNEAVEQIKDNDTADNDSTRTFFTYELKNIVASELQNKLGSMTLDGVEFYFGSYPQLTKSFVVYCAKNQVDSVKSLLNSLDNNLGEIYYPLETITDTTTLSALPAKEEIVVKLVNIPSISTDSFYVSDDLDPSADGVKYILYLLESPENIDAIIDMWGRVG